MPVVEKVLIARYSLDSAGYKTTRRGPDVALGGGANVCVPHETRLIINIITVGPLQAAALLDEQQKKTVTVSTRASLNV